MGDDKINGSAWKVISILGIIIILLMSIITLTAKHTVELAKGDLIEHKYELERQIGLIRATLSDFRLETEKDFVRTKTFQVLYVDVEELKNKIHKIDSKLDVILERLSKRLPE